MLLRLAEFRLASNWLPQIASISCVFAKTDRYIPILHRKSTLLVAKHVKYISVNKSYKNSCIFTFFWVRNNSILDLRTTFPRLMSLLFSPLRRAFIDSAFTLIGSYLLQCFSKLKPSAVHGRNLRGRLWENVHWPQFFSDYVGKNICHQVAEVTWANRILKKIKYQTSYSQSAFNRRFNNSQSTNHSTISLYSVNMKIALCYSLSL